MKSLLHCGRVLTTKLALCVVLFAISVQSQTPTNLTVRQTGINRIEISWTEVLPLPPASSYLITISNELQTQTGTATATSSPFTAVLPQPGFYNIRLRTPQGETIGPVNITVRAFFASRITLSSRTTTSLTISFETIRIGLPADSYRISLQRSPGILRCTGNNMDILQVMRTTAVIPVTFAGLDEFSSYRVNVTSMRLGRTRTSSAIFSTLSEAPSGTPQNIVFSVTSRNVSVSWDPIECTQRNGPITSYAVNLWLQSGSPSSSGTTTNSFFTSGLTPYTTYNFRVAGVNPNGTGPFTNTHSFRTALGPVSSIRNVTRFTSVTLTWLPPEVPNGVVSRYEVTYRINSTALSRTSIMATTFIIPSLTVQTRVSDISVTPYTQSDRGETASIPSITTPPSPSMVMNVQVEILSSSSVRVTWDSINLPYISSYIVYYYQTGTSMNEQSVNVSRSENTVVIENLMRNMVYQFQVVAIAELADEMSTGQRSGLVTVPIVQPTIGMTTLSTTGDVINTTVGQVGQTSSATNALPTTSSASAGAIVGGILGAFAFIILWILVILIVYGFMRKNSKDPMTYTRMEFSNDKSQVTINFDSGPVIEEFPEHVSVMEGEEVLLKVAARGNPQPFFTWFHNGIKLDPDYSLLIDVRPDGSLSIESTEVKQSGVYKLQARNSKGMAEKELRLNVEPLGPPVAGRKIEMPVPMDEFGQYVSQNHLQLNKGFKDQFSILESSGEDYFTSVGRKKRNTILNRFADITVYDHNRVLLNPLPNCPDCQHDYINASYIDGYSRPKKFIATQGPKENTVIDFWRLVWQEKATSIVMVTNLRENGRFKCQQYWPDSGSETYGPFCVKLLDSEVFAEYCIRTFQISFEQDTAEMPLTVKQYHFTSWPDHGVPEVATSMLSFYKRIVSQHETGPILVHCSAGVGRTGTFICIDIVLEQIKKENVVDIIGTIRKLRKQRMRMVQSVEQYIFIHDAILESVICGNTEISPENFRQVVSNLRMVDKKDGKIQLQREYEVLGLVSPKQSDVVHIVASQHPDRNRSQDFLPSDRYRVALHGAGESPSYIHAVFVKGYKHKRAYIIAEGPMASTTRNMWKVIHDMKCGAIVMLSNLVEDGVDTSFQYWPKEVGELAQFEDCTVKMIDEEVLDGYTTRTLDLTHLKSQTVHQVKQFHITCWKPDGQCSNFASVMTVISKIGAIQRKTGNNPIFVHCSDTVTRSGMFCAIATIIDRCKTEGVVDVFQAVKALRVQKPGAVPTLESYKVTYDAILAFLDSFDTYANFKNV